MVAEDEAAPAGTVNASPNSTAHATACDLITILMAIDENHTTGVNITEQNRSVNAANRLVVNFWTQHPARWFQKTTVRDELFICIYK